MGHRAAQPYPVSVMVVPVGLSSFLPCGFLSRACVQSLISPTPYLFRPWSVASTFVDEHWVSGLWRTCVSKSRIRTEAQSQAHLHPCPPCIYVVPYQSILAFTSDLPPRLFSPRCRCRRVSTSLRHIYLISKNYSFEYLLNSAENDIVLKLDGCMGELVSLSCPRTTPLFWGQGCTTPYFEVRDVFPMEYIEHTLLSQQASPLYTLKFPIAYLMLSPLYHKPFHCISEASPLYKFLLNYSLVLLKPLPISKVQLNPWK